MQPTKSLFFASDFHLGLRTSIPPVERERRVVGWLQTIAPRAEALYLLGDIFDFWYEYKRVVPKGFTRFLGQLSAFADAGIPVHILTGNHDIWLFDYLAQECGVVVHTQNFTLSAGGITFYLSHGDSLADTSLGFRLMSSCFHSPILQGLFSTLVHPDLAMWLGHTWSAHSRESKPLSRAWRGEEEPVVSTANRLCAQQHIDFVLIGHLHLALIHPLAGGSHLAILGDWIQACTYAEWNGANLSLYRYRNPSEEPELLAHATPSVPPLHE